MIDILDQIKPMLEFESEDDFYYLQIMQRKKENPQLGSNSRVVKNYYIRNFKDLETRYDEIKAVCKLFNARAMLRLNKRSFRNVAFKTMQNIANSMANGEYSFIRKSYDRACGDGHNDTIKKWIIDIDGEHDESYVQAMIDHIERSRPEGKKLLLRLPTKNGIHLITRPFDLRDFKPDYPDVDVHKDNPVNLFVP